MSTTPGNPTGGLGRPVRLRGPQNGLPRIEPARAIGVVVVAIVVGVLCLGVGARPPVGSRETTFSSATTVPSPTSSTTTTTSSPTVAATAAVKVLVANGETVSGAAAYFATKLKKDGWGTLAPVTATGPASTSTVYYATGQSRFADAIAASLGLSRSTVQPISPATPVSSVAGANVVLVVGSNLAAEIPAATGSTAAATSSGSSAPAAGATSSAGSSAG